MSVHHMYTDVRSTILTYEHLIPGDPELRLVVRMRFRKEDPKYYSSISTFCILSDKAQDEFIMQHLQKCAQEFLEVEDPKDLVTVKRKIQELFCKVWHETGLDVVEFSLEEVED